PVDVVALCDVDGRGLEQAAGHCPAARTYRDFRRLYEDSPAFDGVVVSTCEHTHAFATLPALRMGKAVYCEKPLTLNVQEARLVREAAAAAKVPTQMGTQIHAGENYRRVVEFVRGGAIGPVSEVHVWVNRAWGLQSQAEAEANKDPYGWYAGPDGARTFATARPAEIQTPPEHLDWDLWLGPAPQRPFHEVYHPGPKWYRWWDFGNGTPTSSPFDPYAGLLTEANHLGNVAFRAGGKLLWDSRAMRVTNTRAADRFLAREPRAGWSLRG
ncbi:MAG: Gfo/Idh/MocA family oxidoreductase, partial [Planctomycetia bacterium]